ncbi:MAG TPA: hypothetical protein VFS67_07635, partial [Polyangiaceae bacterium]|nr:hypothetical protein [Polyangiaceae bacterium]
SRPKPFRATKAMGDEFSRELSANTRQKGHCSLRRGIAGALGAAEPAPVKIPSTEIDARPTT